MHGSYPLIRSDFVRSEEKLSLELQGKHEITGKLFLQFVGGVVLYFVLFHSAPCLGGAIAILKSCGKQPKVWGYQ